MILAPQEQQAWREAARKELAAVLREFTEACASLDASLRKPLKEEHPS